MNKFFKTLLIPYSGKFEFPYVLIAVQALIICAIWFLFPGKDIPSIGNIITAWERLATTEGLLIELWVSIKTITASIGISALLSLLIVYGSTSAAFKPTAYMISSFRFLGFAGLTFLFTIWTSGATMLKLSLLTFGMTVFLVTSMLAEVESISSDSIDYVKTMKFKGWRITWEVVVLGKMDVMLDIIRQNAAMGWTMLAMVEGITRSQGGIGGLLINQNRTFDLAAIFAIQMCVMFWGILQDFILGMIRNILCPYSNLVKVK